MEPLDFRHHDEPKAPLVIAVGRIRLRPDASRMRFFLHTLLSILQAKRAQGNLHVSTHAAKGAHYSMSVWRSVGDMHAFARRGAHKRAMRAMTALAAEGSFHHWHDDRVPTWPEALTRFGAEPDETRNTPYPPEASSRWGVDLPSRSGHHGGATTFRSLRCVGKPSMTWISPIRLHWSALT